MKNHMNHISTLIGDLLIGIITLVTWGAETAFYVMWCLVFGNLIYHTLLKKDIK